MPGKLYAGPDYDAATLPLVGTEEALLNVGGVVQKTTTQDIADLASAGAGDVNGPASSTDNAIARFDSTTGKIIQDSVVTVADSGAIAGYLGTLNQQTGTTYTLQASDAGKIVELSNGAVIALTAANSLPAGFCCTVVQGGAGQVTVASTGSGTVVNRQSQFKTAGQNAMCALYVRSNSGTNAVWVFGGDTAA